MFEDLMKTFAKTATTIAMREGILVEEDGVLLKKSTIELVDKIEEANLQHLIDMALDTGNKNLFMQLTAKEGVGC